ncbi:MAG: iron-containing alcohol dehydrogenase [Clostridia bacterium]|nr:iron-containing alcohol dehydrogenase [Clostridia bacterium]
MKGYFEFYNPVKICAGEDALGNLLYEAQNLGMRRPLLLTDETLTRLGVVKRFRELTGLDDCVVFDRVPADSGVDTVNEIAALLRREACVGIIALGGGSVLDTAKGVKLLLSQDKEDILGLMGCENLPRGRYVPCIAVPTTAGTGSECTPVAVIRHPAKSVKLEFISPWMMPDAAVLDARMTRSLPPRVTAATGLDALCHAIEACTCDMKNPMSDAYAFAAIRILTEKLPEVVARGESPARMDVAVAACMAGAAFGNSMVGAVHAIGHALGGVCRIAHGEAMAILLPHVMAFNRAAKPELYDCLKPCFPGEDPVAAVRGFVSRVGEGGGLPLRLRDTGRFDRAQIPEITEKALNDGAIIVNPVHLSKEDVAKLLLAAE